MSVDTCAYLKGKIDKSAILKFVKENIDENAFISFEQEHEIKQKNEVKDLKESYGDDDCWCIHTFCIDVYYNNESYSISYYYSNINCWESLGYYSKIGLEDMVKSEKTYLSLYCCDDSKKIIKSIVEHFGGWYDENDCDEFDYIYIPNNNSGLTVIEGGSFSDERFEQKRIENIEKAYNMLVSFKSELLRQGCKSYANDVENCFKELWLNNIKENPPWKK